MFYRSQQPACGAKWDLVRGSKLIGQLRACDRNLRIEWQMIHFVNSSDSVMKHGSWAFAFAISAQCFFSIRLQLIKRRKEDNKSFLTRNNKITNIIAQYSTIFTTNRRSLSLPHSKYGVRHFNYSVFDSMEMQTHCEQNILNKKNGTALN